MTRPAPSSPRDKPRLAAELEQAKMQSIEHILSQLIPTPRAPAELRRLGNLKRGQSRKVGRYG
jgi:hypothetical protein